MTVTEYAAHVRNVLKQYDEGAIMASELHQNLLTVAAYDVNLYCRACGKDFGEVAPVICDTCGADTLPPIEGDLS